MERNGNFFKYRTSEIISSAFGKQKDLRVIRYKKTELDDRQWRITAKVSDRYNYVHHVEALFSDDGSTVVIRRCDCMHGDACGRMCSHGAALVQYAVDFILEDWETAPASSAKAPDEEAVTAQESEEFAASEKAICLDAPFDYLKWLDEETGSPAEMDPEPPFEEEEPAEEDEPVDEDIPVPEPETAVPAVPRSMRILLGTNKESEKPVYWCPNDTEQVFHTNMGIIGTMGTGKTQFTKSLITQLHMQQHDNFDGAPVGILIFDYKGDYNTTKTDFITATKARVLKPYRIPYNPLALNRTTSFIPLLPVHTANTFKDTISKIYNLGHKQQQLLFDCILAAYQQQGIAPEEPETWDRKEPTFEQVYQIFERETEGRTPDSLTSVMKKLHQFCIFEGVPSRARSLAGLLKGVVVMDLSGYDEDIQSLVIAITLDQFYAQMHAHGSSASDRRYRQLRKLILVDEADNFMSQNFPSLRKIMKEGREFGVGVILSTQSLSHFVDGNDDYSKYILTWVIHNVSDLSQRDIEYVLKLPHKSPEIMDVYTAVKNLIKHESIVRIAKENPLTIRDKAFWQLYQENFLSEE